MPDAKPHRLRGEILHGLGAWFIVWATLLMLTSLPLLSTWLRDRNQVTIQDLFLPLLLRGVLVTGLTLIFFWFSLKNRVAALAGGIGALLMLDHYYRHPFLSFVVDKKTAPTLHFVFFYCLVVVVCAVIFTVGLYFLTRKWKKITDILAMATLIGIGVAFLLKFVVFVQVVITEWSQFHYRPPAFPTAFHSDDIAAKPDIYYIILDRYTSQSVLTKQFGFDNGEFINFLKKNSFSVNPDALDNYPYTTMSIASTLNASYITDLVTKFRGASDQTLQPYHDAIHYASVIQALKSIGYTYDHLGTWYEATNRAPLADHLYQPEGQLTLFNRQVTMNDFSKKDLAPSFFNTLVERGLTIGDVHIVGYSGQTAIQATMSKFDILDKLALERPGGRFIFAHMLVPHDPYYFRADGSLNPNFSVDNVGEPIKQKYVEQVRFVNVKMQEIITKILSGSNNEAIIIIQSDEGPYPMELNGEQFNLDAVVEELTNGDMRSWSDTDVQMKYGILAAYHIPKATEKDLISGGDPVNIFRLVFNTTFGTNVPFLPLCYYAYPQGRMKSFTYVNINDRLTGNTNTACSGDSR